MDEFAAYYKNLIPYIPRTIADWYGKARPGERHVLSEHEGIIVCIDASGFTALTRQLSQRGKEGPEILTAVLNLFFEAISGVIFNYRGDVLKFAGDALWAYMPETMVLGDFFRSVLDALDGVNSSNLLRDRTELQVHVGAEFGQFYLVSIGDPDVRLEAEPLGNMLDVVYRACDTAGGNEFAVGPCLSRQRSLREQLIPIDNDFSLVQPSPEVTMPKTSPAAPDEDGRLPEDGSFLKAYIAQDVLRKIKTSVPSMSVQGEHRQVVVLFANFENNFGRRGDDPHQAIDVLNAKLKTGFDIIRQFHGSIARIDPFRRGHKLLVLFGAPTKRENDETNALMCATRLLELADDSFRLRIGLAIGPLFCGDVGATRRREYTVMGDGINLAARLMSKTAWTEMLIGDLLRSRLPEEIVTEQVTLSLKGIGKAAVCHRFVGVSERTRTDDRDLDIIGQSGEMARLDTIWRETREGFLKLVVVTGDTGVGKSTLVRNFRHLHDPGRVAKLECKNSLLFGRGWLVKKLLEKLLANSARHGGRSLQDFVTATIDEKWLPLLADIVGSTERDNTWTRGLSPELRTAKMKELFAILIRSAVDMPQAVIVDDFDMADELFRMLLLSLGEESDPVALMVVVVLRDISALSTDEKTAEMFEKIPVDGPSTDEWWSFFSDRFEQGKREKDLFKRVLKASRGNPHFIMQFLDKCRSAEQLVSNPVTGRFELAASALKISIPDNLASLHLSIFDSLPEIQRTLLKAAAVAVGDFSAKLIGQVITELEHDDICDYFASLRDTGVLFHKSNNDRYNFAHSSMRQAIYECIPNAQQREFHHHYAELIEQKNSDRHFGLLAYHFHRAGRWEKSFTYSLKAAIESFDSHALAESAEYFGQCAQVVTDYRDADLVLDDRLEFYSQYSEFLVREGRYREAYGIIRDWRHLGRAEQDAHQYLVAAIKAATLLFRQSRYSRSRKVLETALNLAQSLSDKDVLAMTYSLMTQLDRRTGRLAEAQLHGTKAIAMAEEAGNWEVVSEARNRLGLAYWGAGKLDEAAEIYRKILETEHDNQLRTALTKHNLAFIEQDRGSFKAAEVLLTEALETFRSVGDRRNEAYSYGNLSNLCRISGKLMKTRELLLRADLIFERLGERHSHFYAVGNLGDLDLMRGDVDPARAKYTSVAQFAEEVNDQELLSECEVRFGELAFFTGDIAQAESRYRKAISVSEKHSSVEFLIRGCIGLARLLIGERDHQQALEIIKRVSELAASNNAILFEHEADFLTGEHYRIRNEPELAAESYLKTLAYAQKQNIFELTLKSAVRLYEISPDHRNLAADMVKAEQHTFVENNDREWWNSLVGSAYFSYFARTLSQILPKVESARVQSL